MDAMVAYLDFGGAEGNQKAPERRHQAKARLGSGAASFLCSTDPKLSLGPGGSTLGSVAAPAHGHPGVLPVGQCPGQPAGGSRWVSGAGLSVLRNRAPPPGRWGAAKEFGGLWSLEQDLSCFREAQVKC